MSTEFCWLRDNATSPTVRRRARAADIRTRHIGDFRKWKDHDSFQESLDRLLRDLKSQGSKPK